MLLASSVSKSVSAYSPSSSSKLKMTFVVCAVALAIEKAKTEVATTAPIRKQIGVFIVIIPPEPGFQVKNVLARILIALIATGFQESKNAQSDASLDHDLKLPCFQFGLRQGS